MTETITTLAQADATTTTPETTVTVTPQDTAPATTNASETTVEATVETTEAKSQQDERLRDEAGRFLPNDKRVKKLVEHIHELTRKKHDKRRELEALTAEAARIQHQLKNRPQIDPQDFEGQQAEIVRRAVKTERLEDLAQRYRSVQAETQATSQNIIATQVEDLRNHIPDIDAIFQHPSQGGPMISNVMAEELAEMDNGALVAYHLLKNPREAARLYNSDERTVIRELQRIAVNVRPAPVKRVSQAPQPVQTVSGSIGNPSPDLANLSFKDYERVRNEQELAKRYP